MKIECDETNVVIQEETEPPLEINDTSRVIKTTEELTIFKVPKTPKVPTKNTARPKNTVESSGGPPSEQLNQTPKGPTKKTARPKNTVESSGDPPSEQLNHCKTCLTKYSGDECLVCEKIFKCKICGQKFSGPNGLNLHIAQVHDDSEKVIKDALKKRRAPRCLYCMKGFTDVSQLNEHMKEHENAQRQHTCIICEGILPSIHSLKIHMRKAHRKKSETCNLCSLVIPRTLLQDHMLQFHKYSQDISIECYICKTKFDDNDSYTKHMLNHSESLAERKKQTATAKKQRFVCPVCSNTFSSIGNGKNHLKNIHHWNLRKMKQFFQSNERPHGAYVCKICSSEFTRYIRLVNHINSIHSDKESAKVCRICQKICNNADALKTHFEKAHGARASLKRQTQNEQSQNISTSQVGPNKTRPYSCSYCAGTYLQEHHLKTHLERTHKIGYERKRVRKGCGVSTDGFPNEVTDDKSLILDRISLRSRGNKDLFRTTGSTDSLASTSYSTRAASSYIEEMKTTGNIEESLKMRKNNRSKNNKSFIVNKGVTIKDDLTILGNNGDVLKTNNSRGTEYSKKTISTNDKTDSLLLNRDEIIKTIENKKVLFKTTTTDEIMLANNKLFTITGDDNDHNKNMLKMRINKVDYCNEPSRTTVGADLPSIESKKLSEAPSNKIKATTSHNNESAANEDKKINMQSTQSKRVQRKRTDKNEFKCAIYSLEFSETSDFDVHLSDHEARDEFDVIHACKYCDRVFDSSESLTNHMLDQHTTQLSKKEKNQEKSIAKLESTGQTLEAMRFQLKENE